MVNLSLSQCPYDGSPLGAEIGRGGLLLLVCASCDATWETHGSYVGRVRDPDRNKVIAARRMRPAVHARDAIPPQDDTRPSAHMSHDELAANVGEHLAEAIKRTENANDVVVAQFIANKTNYGGRTDGADRAQYVFALAKVVGGFRFTPTRHTTQPRPTA